MEIKQKETVIRRNLSDRSQFYTNYYAKWHFTGEHVLNTKKRNEKTWQKQTVLKIIQNIEAKDERKRRKVTYFEMYFGCFAIFSMKNASSTIWKDELYIFTSFLQSNIMGFWYYFAAFEVLHLCASTYFLEQWPKFSK